MVGLQLYVLDENNVYQHIELFKDESVTLTQTLADVKDISKVFTDYTQTFNVPASKKNNTVFEHFYNYHINTYDARRKTPAKLFLNYQEFKVGKIKLEGTTLKENKAHTYKLTFYGNGVNLKDILGEDKLDALTLLQNFNFDYTSANIKAYLAGGLDKTIVSENFVDAIVFPLISHTKRFVWDASLANTTTQCNLSNTTGTSVGLELNQLKPALRVYVIIKAIESQLNYNIKFSDDFFNTTNLPFYNLYLWMHRKKGGINTGTLKTVTFGTFTKSGDYDVVDIFLNNIVNPAAGYKRSIQDRQRKISLEITPTDLTQKYNFLIYKDGILYQEFKEIAGVNNTLIQNLKIPKGTYTFGVQSSAADTYSIKGTVERTYNSTWTSPKKRHFTATAAIVSSGAVNSTNEVPDIKIIDFISGLFKMFNLTSFQNEAGVIEVKTLDSYYTDSNLNKLLTYDITKDLDKDGSQVDTILPFKEVNFKYEGTDNFFAKNHKELFNKNWGELNYNGNEDTKIEGQTYNILLPFEHFKFERLFNQNSILTNIQWGWSSDVSAEDSTTEVSPYLGKPLLFYPVLNTLVLQIKDLEDSVSTITSAYVPSNSYKLSPVVASSTFPYFLDSSENLNFCAEYNEYTGSPFTKTLFEKYYKTYLREVFDPKRRLTTVSAYLPLNVLLNIRLNDRIKIADRVYKINKFSTNFENNKSTFELINIINTSLLPTTVLTDFNTTFTPVLPSASISSVSCITADTIDYRADNTNLTADLGCNTDGVVFTNFNTDVPTTIPNNTPNTDSSGGISDAITGVNNDNSISGDNPCLTTPPTLSDATQTENTASTIFFSNNITSLGKICDTVSLGSYGFLYANTEAELAVSNDVDVLKTSSGVTDITFIVNNSNDLSYIKKYTTSVQGLSYPATKYWRFYARTVDTSTIGGFDLADAITGIKAAATYNGITYTATADIREYQFIDYTSPIRTFRIKNSSDVYEDYTGIKGKIIFFSKIIPYTIGNGGQATFDPIYTGAAYSGLKFYGSNGVFYHATIRGTAENNAYNSGQSNNSFTGLTNETEVFFANQKSTAETQSNLMNALKTEGITLYSNTATVGTFTKAADGFYAMNNVDQDGNTRYSGLEDASFFNSGYHGISVNVVNGFITDKEKWSAYFWLPNVSILST